MKTLSLAPQNDKNSPTLEQCHASPGKKCLKFTEFGDVAMQNVTHLRTNNCNPRFC